MNNKVEWLELDATDVTMSERDENVDLVLEDLKENDTNISIQLNGDKLTMALREEDGSTRVFEAQVLRAGVAETRTFN